MDIRFWGGAIAKAIEKPLRQPVSNQYEIWWHRQCLNNFAFASKHEHIEIVFISLPFQALITSTAIDQNWAARREGAEQVNGQQPERFRIDSQIRRVSIFGDAMRCKRNKTRSRIIMAYQFSASWQLDNNALNKCIEIEFQLKLHCDSFCHATHFRLLFNWQR